MARDSPAYRPQLVFGLDLGREQSAALESVLASQRAHLSAARSSTSRSPQARNTTSRPTDSSEEPEKYLSAASFSHDGQWVVVTASDDGTARVWRADGSSEAVILRGHKDGVNAASFSLDGEFVVTASMDKTARVWLADPSTLVPRICQSVGRNLTRKEWALYIPDRPYRETCALYLR